MIARSRRLVRLVRGGVGAVVLVAVLSAHPVGAQTGGGELGSGSVRATAADLGAGTFGGTGIAVREPALESPFEWVRGSTSGVCVALADPLPPELVGRVGLVPGPTIIRSEPWTSDDPIGVPRGTRYVTDPSLLPAGVERLGDLMIVTAQFRTWPFDIITVPRCVRPGDPLLSDPPSAAEIWEQVPLPRPVIHASPPGTRAWPGVVHLPSHLWGDGVASTTAAVAIRGFDVRATATPVAYAWDLADGGTRVQPDPGTAAAPAVVTFRRRGVRTVRLYVVWEGRAQLSLFGIPLGEMDLGTVTVPESIPYRVGEVRTELRSTPGR